MFCQATARLKLLATFGLPFTPSLYMCAIRPAIDIARQEFDRYRSLFAYHDSLPEFLGLGENHPLQHLLEKSLLIPTMISRGRPQNRLFIVEHFVSLIIAQFPFGTLCMS